MWHDRFARVMWRHLPPPGPGLALAVWCCLSMLGAAVVLAVSSPALRRGAVIQGAAPLVFLVLAALRSGLVG